MKQLAETDVVVIGAGIGGASIARELSRYKLDVVLLDKAESYADGQSKAAQMTLYRGLMMLTSKVAKSFILKQGEPMQNPDSKMERQEHQSWKLWHQEWLPQLDIPFRRSGVLVAATKETLDALSLMWKMKEAFGGIYNEIEWVDREFILEKEPMLNKNVVAGLWATGHHATTVYPWDQTIALIENAQQNGVRMIRGCKVMGISCKGDIQIIETNKGPVKTRFIVNSAGIYADRIARMVGPIDWEMAPQSGGGACMITDKNATSELASGRNIVSMAPKPGYLEAFSPTLGGNLYFNCGKYKAIANREGLSVSREELELSVSVAKGMIPALSEKHIVRFFTAVRAYHTGEAEEHVVGHHPENHRFINAAFRLPAFNAAPAVATYEIPQLLSDAGLEITTKTDFNPHRKAIPKFNKLSGVEKAELIEKDPKYGHVVCRCEHVTEGEIAEAIKRGGRTLQDIKFMTGAGLGRCQAGFCSPHVVRFLSRELNIPVTNVLEKNSESQVTPYEAKEFLLAAKRDYKGSVNQ